MIFTKLCEGPDERFEWERSQDKNDCIFFDKKSMAGDSSRLDELVEEIYNILEMGSHTNFNYNARKLATARKDKTIIRMVLWHLYLANQDHSDRYVAVSLRSDTFKYCDTYNPYRINKRISAIIRKLHEKRLIDFHIGFMTVKTSKCTRIRSSIQLAIKLESLPHDLQEVSNVFQPIIFKNRETKKVIDKFTPLNDADVEDAIEIVSRYNEVMINHKISLKGRQHQRFYWTDSTDRRRVTHLNRRFLYAIGLVDVDAYTAASILYFRMHGACWQGLPKQFRPDLLIDGAETTELDYTAQILNIAASINNIQLDVDPYCMNLGLGNISYKANKAIVKKAIVIMLNCSDEKSAIMALRKGIHDEQNLMNEIRNSIINFRLTDVVLAGFFKRLIEKYPFLNDLSFRGLGLSIFKIDAAIARSIMRRHLDANKVILPIHDGFIVKKEDRDFLRKAMSEVWWDKFNTTINVKDENI